MIFYLATGVLAVISWAGFAAAGYLIAIRHSEERAAVAATIARAGVYAEMQSVVDDANKRLATITRDSHGRSAKKDD